MDKIVSKRTKRRRVIAADLANMQTYVARAWPHTAGGVGANMVVGGNGKILLSTEIEISGVCVIGIGVELRPLGGEMFSYFETITRFFQLSGRSSRAQYWWTCLVMAVLGVGAIYIDFRTTGMLPSRDNLGSLTTFVLLFHLIPGVTITVRRLHDVGKSGWWYLLNFVPFGALFLLFWMFCASEIGSNEYGDPVGAADREAELSPIIRRAIRTSGRHPSTPQRAISDSSQQRFI